jgi:uncharacterized OB-fold protein
MRLYQKQCKKCGEVFITTRRYQKLCLFCAIENEQESIRKSYEKRKLQEGLK